MPSLSLSLSLLSVVILLYITYSSSSKPLNKIFRNFLLKVGEKDIRYLQTRFGLLFFRALRERERETTTTTSRRREMPVSTRRQKTSRTFTPGVLEKEALGRDDFCDDVAPKGVLRKNGKTLKKTTTTTGRGRVAEEWDAHANEEEEEEEEEEDDDDESRTARKTSKSKDKKTNPQTSRGGTRIRRQRNRSDDAPTKKDFFETEDGEGPRRRKNETKTRNLIVASTPPTTTSPPTTTGSPSSRRGSRGSRDDGAKHQRFISWKKIMRNVAPFCVLSVQYGAQPLLTKKFISTNVSSLGVVAATECMKIVLCLILMRIQGPREIRRQFRKVRLKVFALSVVPAICYSIQNVLMQYGYHSVDAVLFNCLNQTKIIWTALFVYVVFGTRQTFVQCLCLLGLMLASVILQIKEILEPAVDAQKSLGDVNGGGETGTMMIEEEDYARYLGVLAVTAASCLSGLASTSTQISLEALRRPAQMLTIEMAIASIPIVYFVHISKLAFGDEVFVQQQQQTHLQEHAAERSGNNSLASSAAIQRLFYAGSTEWFSMFDHFTLLTFVPIFTSAVGGICVGLVTKNLGSVAKGFAITIGLILTGVIESVAKGEMLQAEQIVGLLLVGVCTHCHTVYAHQEPLTSSQIRIAAAAAKKREERLHQKKYE